MTSEGNALVQYFCVFVCNLLVCKDLQGLYLYNCIFFAHLCVRELLLGGRERWDSSSHSDQDKGKAGTGLPSTALPALLWRTVVAGVV